MEPDDKEKIKSDVDTTSEPVEIIDYGNKKSEVETTAEFVEINESGKKKTEVDKTPEPVKITDSGFNKTEVDTTAEPVEITESGNIKTQVDTSVEPVEINQSGNNKTEVDKTAEPKESDDKGNNKTKVDKTLEPLEIETTQRPIVCEAVDFSPNSRNVPYKECMSKFPHKFPLVKTGRKMNVQTYAIDSVKMNMPLRKPLRASNPIVFLDIAIGEEFCGRMIIELRKDKVPKTAENFRCLCTGERGMGQRGRPLHYKGINFHKAIAVYCVVGGDIVSNDGTNGDSIYGPLFADESKSLKHDEGAVTMIHYEQPNSNNSQFAITSAPCPNLDGENVVVGRVLRGLAINSDMELYVDDQDKPIVRMYIKDCGEIHPGDDWGINDDDETDDKFPPYPQDWPKKFDKFTLEEAEEILMTIRKSGNHFFTTGRYTEARRKYRKTTRYHEMLRKRFADQKPQKEDPEERHEEYKEVLEKFHKLAIANHCNMAAAELKLENYNGARDCCDEAIKLDIECSKAHFRRGQANIGLKNYDVAVKDLLNAQELTPDDKGIQTQLTRARKLSSDWDRKQSVLFKKMFK